MTRRRLLALVVAAGVGAAGWRVVGEGGADSPEERLTAVLGDRDSARSVGRHYLDGRPDERDEQALLRLLRPLGDTELLTQDDLAARIRRAVRSDFAEGRIVSVEGWYLSETEARLCALSTFV